MTHELLHRSEGPYEGSLQDTTHAISEDAAHAAQHTQRSADSALNQAGAEASRLGASLNSTTQQIAEKAEQGASRVQDAAADVAGTVAARSGAILPQVCSVQPVPAQICCGVQLA